MGENVAVNPTVAMTSSFAGPSDNGLPALIPTELDPRLQAEELISLPDLSTAMGPGAAARAVRRSHPLYVACALSIGTEIAKAKAEQAKASAMPQMTAEQMAAFGKILSSFTRQAGVAAPPAPENNK